MNTSDSLNTKSKNLFI